MLEDNGKCTEYVEDSHKRNKVNCNCRNACKSAPYDKAGEYCQSDRSVDMRDAERHKDSFSCRVGLDHVSYAEGGKEREEGEEYCKPLHSKSLLKDVHRAAPELSLFILFTEPDRQRNFTEFRRHAEYSGYKHPYKSSGASEVECRSDACDVTGPYCCGKCGSHCGKR